MLQHSYIIQIRMQVQQTFPGRHFLITVVDNSFMNIQNNINKKKLHTHIPGINYFLGIYEVLSLHYSDEPCREKRHNEVQNRAISAVEVANMRQAYLFFLVSGFPSSCRHGPASIDICHVLQCTLFAI